MTTEKSIIDLRAAIEDNDLPKAESICRRTLREHGENAKVSTMLAKTLRLQGRTEEAEAAYLDTMRRNGRTPFATIGLAAVYMDAGRYPEAEALCKEALALDPRNIPAMRTLGAVYFRMGEKIKGASCFSMIVADQKTAV
jgi:cytochrome c-type biogenesis protein CcmH/NrfG